MSPRMLKHFMNWWPPFLTAGIHVTHLAPDWRYARVELRLRPWNRNYVGTHYGGNLFSMTDPFWMIMILRALGKDYFVWDQAAEIAYLKPGKGTVSAEFTLDDATLNRIRAACADGAKHLIWLPVEVRDAHGDVVVRARRQIYIRRKPAARGTSNESTSS